ncbi:MAG: hypothetical protein ABIS01_05860 [Ferruginibacter sp.]
MKFLRISSILLLCILFFAAEPITAQRKRPAKKVKTGPTENNAIKNGIKLKVNGFKVSEAYLVFDDETLVPEANKVELNQNVNMLLIIDEGWTETGGKVFPGSKQVVKLNNGKEIINSEDYFAAFDETGVSIEDARYITLNTLITDEKNRKNYLIINFRVWDKKGTAEITGSYKLYIK